MDLYVRHERARVLYREALTNRSHDRASERRETGINSQTRSMLGGEEWGEGGKKDRTSGSC
jgi:hypothetical protein